VAQTRQPDLFMLIMIYSPVAKAREWTSLPISRGHDPLIPQVHPSSHRGCEGITYDPQAGRVEMDVKASDPASSYAASHSQLPYHDDEYGLHAPSQDFCS